MVLLLHEVLVVVS
jgi:hypothetical protein